MKYDNINSYYHDLREWKPAGTRGVSYRTAIPFLETLVQ